MAKAGGFNELTRHVEALRQCPPDLSYLDRVGHSRPQEVRRTRRKDLCLALEAAKRNAVNDPRSITLEDTARILGSCRATVTQARSVSCAPSQSYSSRVTLIRDAQASPTGCIPPEPPELAALPIHYT